MARRATGPVAFPMPFAARFRDSATEIVGLERSSRGPFYRVV